MKKNPKLTVIIILVAAIAAAGAFAFFYLGRHSRENENKTQNNSQSAPYSQESEKPQSSEVSSAAETQSAPESEAVSAEQEPDNSYMLPLSVNEVMNILEARYGDGYEVNSTVEENGLNYFAVFRNGERYASVEANLVTGRAVETITETGERTSFSLI